MLRGSATQVLARPGTWSGRALNYFELDEPEEPVPSLLDPELLPLLPEPAPGVPGVLLAPALLVSEPLLELPELLLPGVVLAPELPELLLGEE